MAQTWPPNRWKVALVGLIDAIARPAARAARFAGASEGAKPKPSTILVVEIWRIGDVVLATPFLRALRECFPLARITLLGQAHAAELLAESGLVDEVVVAELPWTRTSGKYSPRDYASKKLLSVIRRLRERKFDISFDARMDLRSNVLTSLIGARRRVGFAHGGGDWLLTDAVPVDPQANHKAEDWLALLPAAGCERPRKTGCLLVTSDSERAEARRSIAAAFPPDRPVVAIHPGGSYAGKRWPLHSFVELARELTARGCGVAAFLDPSGYGAELAAVAGVVTYSPSLRQLMALLEQCDLLVCNDSGPMHVAAALGVRTVAIFERGEPKWFGPVGENHVVISGGLAGVAVSAIPVSVPPKNPVPFKRVLEAALSQLERRDAKRTPFPSARQLY